MPILLNGENDNYGRCSVSLSNRRIVKSIYKKALFLKCINFSFPVGGGIIGCKLISLANSGFYLWR